VSKSLIAVFSGRINWCSGVKDGLFGIPVGIDTTECSPERLAVPKTEMLVGRMVGFAMDMVKRV